MRNFLEKLGAVFLGIISFILYFIFRQNKKLKDENGALKITNDIHTKNNELNNTDLPSIVHNHNNEIKSRNSSE